MKRIRIGNNIAITWLLYENDGNIHNLEERDLELYMTSGGYKYPVTDYTVTENAIAWTFPAKLQTKTGYYKLVLLERDEAKGLHSYDVKDAFCLEPGDALTNIGTIANEDCTVLVKSVLTYAHITNISTIDTVDASDGSGDRIVTIRLTNGKSFSFAISGGSGGGGGSDINVIDSLTSTSKTDALSANQGRALSELINSIEGVETIDNLDSTSRTKALSANMGRYLKELIDSIEPGGGGGGGGSVTIVDNLEDGGRTSALSAEQGKYLKYLIDNISSGSIDGGSLVETMYSSVTDSPGTPATSASNWHSARQSNDIWLAVRFNKEGTWGDWSVIRIDEYEAVYASFKAFVFTRSNATSVAAPTGGSYANPAPDGSVWSDGIPSGTGKIWVSSRKFSSDNNAHGDSAWSTPRVLADNEFMDYEFSSVANPGIPSKATPTSANANPNWSNTADETTIWMAVREVSNGAYKAGSSWMIMKVKGENGKDGTSVAIKGTLPSAADLPTSGNTTGDGYLIDGYLWVWDGDSWENAGKIQGEPGADGQTPYIHIKYSNDGGLHFTDNDGETPGDYIGLYWDYTAEDSSSVADYTWKAWKGEDGFGYEYIFKLTSNATAPSLPSSSPNTDDYVPDGWTDNPGGVTASQPFCWVAYRKKEDGVWSAWIGTANSKARLYSHYGTDGSDGQAQFKSVVFKRSSTQPSTPGTGTSKGSSSYGGTFNDPVPYDWSDGIPALSNVSDPDSLANTLWVTSRIFTSDAQSPQEASWKTPVQVADTDGMDMEFAKEQTNDATPATPTDANRHGGSGTQIWFDPVLDSNQDFTQMCWMAIRMKVNGSGVGNWTILRIKGEAGRQGVDGKDAKNVRIRNWADVYGVSLTGNNKIFSGFEDGAPFRDILVITKSDYPNGTSYPFAGDAPVLLVVNSPANGTGFSGTQLTLPASGNYSQEVASSATDSATKYASNIYYGVFQNLGAIYTAFLAATQAYIGGLTVDHLTTTAGNNSYIEIDDGFISVYDSNGTLRIRIGQGTNDSEPVLKFYNASGTELYNLGPGGLMQNGPISLPTWTRGKFYYSSTEFTVGTDLANAALEYPYLFEDGYKILQGSSASAITYMDPFNPNNYLGSSHSSIHGKYFDQYVSPLTASSAANHYATDGYYIPDQLTWTGGTSEAYAQADGGYATIYNVQCFRLQNGSTYRYDARIREYKDINTKVHVYEVLKFEH